MRLRKYKRRPNQQNLSGGLTVASGNNGELDQKGDEEAGLELEKVPDRRLPPKLGQRGRLEPIACLRSRREIRPIPGVNSRQIYRKDSEKVV